MKTYYERNKKKCLERHKEYIKRPCKDCGKLCWGFRCRDCYLKYVGSKKYRKKNGV